MTGYALVRDPLPYDYLTCTPGELDAYRSILRRLVDAADTGRWVSAWSTVGHSDVEHRAWIALARDGYVTSIPMGAWHVLVATPVGRLYLSQIDPSPAESKVTP